ncbi:MAG: hypothetical protein ALECFALPRED_007781 [Alectoria fallacina]|uniref:Uncharacterized protein n=1 Tax=Alectoria fallacina TaxID=1903189 RepID=A0A8H3EX92_9LECA|nr:MAG: hypothetical protein ALECFALPRED_007781 [Alectoria fallacina]
MISHVLAVLLPIAFASAAKASTDETADCEFSNGTLNVYQHPNVSSSYSIPAVVSTGSTVMNSTTKTWQIINSIGNVSDSSNLLDPQAEQLSQFIFLDTSSTINQTSASSPLPFAGCSFTFALPSSYIGKISNDGSCGNIFGQSCLNEIMQIAQDNTAAIPPAVASMKLIDVCDTVSESITNYIATSSKVCSKNGPSIEVSQGINFSYASTDNCTNPTTYLPIQLFEQYEPFKQGNYTIYDQWTKTNTPILLALFSNGTTLNGADGNYAQTYLTCTSPKNVTAGSHDPTSVADHSAVVDLRSVVGFALAINALVFLML